MSRLIGMAVSNSKKKLMHREVLSGRVQTKITQHVKKTKWRYEWHNHQLKLLKRDEKMKRDMIDYSNEKVNEMTVEKKKKKKKKMKKSSRFDAAYEYFEDINDQLKKEKEKKKKKKKKIVVRISPLREENKFSKRKKKKEKMIRKMKKTLPSHPTIFPPQIGADVEAQWAELREQNKRREEEREYNRRFWGRCVRKRNYS
jgi:hypothetical protein